MAKKVKKSIKVADVVADIPADYSGEVSITRSRATSMYNLHPLEHEFGNGDLNMLRDKLNEIIKIITG